MSYSENNIYIQTTHQCVRNKSILNFNTSSDICVFNPPTYNINGTSKIPCNEGMVVVPSPTSYIHRITSATTKDIKFNFTGNTNSFVDTNANFRYEIYKYNDKIGQFNYPPQYRSEEIEWSTFSGSSSLTQTIPLNNLSIDGEYIIKGYYVHDICTEYAKRLGERNDTSLFRNGDMFGLYESESDHYMVIVRDADKPEFTSNDNYTSGTYTLNQKVIIARDGESEFILPSEVNGDFIVTLNGLSLSKNYDYSVTQYSGGSMPFMITMMGTILEDDIITFIFSAGNSSGLKTDTLSVDTITSGATDNQGNNRVYYNTTTNKYEIYTSITPVSNNGIIIIINGVTLANNIDYYQSTSNSKRLILNDILLIGDMITMAYLPTITFIDSIDTPTPIISWRIENEPQLVNGEFMLEFSTDEEMSNIISSGETKYIINQNSYNAQGLLSGNAGDKLFYRVTNTKKYETICGEIVESVSYSDIIPITLTSNSINSY